MADKLADDLLRGVPAIADYTGESPRQTYDLLETGRLPGFKTPGGRIWHAFKSTIDEDKSRKSGASLVWKWPATMSDRAAQ